MAAAMTASISAEVGGLEGDEDLGSNPAGFSTVNYHDVSRMHLQETSGKVSRTDTRGPAPTTGTSIPCTVRSRWI